MKKILLSIIGTCGSIISYFIGGVDEMFIALCVFITADFIAGIVVAGVFNKSTKTESGKINSSVCYKGLLKKIFIIILVGVANMLDMVLGVSIIRGGTIVAFMVNELISLLENAGLMGVPIPAPIKKALDMLQEK